MFKIPVILRMLGWSLYILQNLKFTKDSGHTEYKYNIVVWCVRADMPEPNLAKLDAKIITPAPHLALPRKGSELTVIHWAEPAAAELNG